MKKLKVLLTNALGFDLEGFDKKHNKTGGYELFPPTELTTIAASTLKQVDDVEIEIQDLDFELKKHFKENEESELSATDLFKKKIIDKMDEFQPDVVGIGAMFSPAHGNALAIANIVKEKNPTTQVICGGNHATFSYKRILKECPMDFVFLYEGDNTFPLFLKYLKGEIKFQDLRGIAWLDKSTNETKKSSYAPLIEKLDELPIPKWNLIPLNKYQKYGKLDSAHRFSDPNLPSYVMQTVRGCIAQCTFCSVRSFFGKGVRALSPKRVLEEIDYLYNDLGIKQLQILDDDFSFDKKRNLEICNGLIKRNYDLVWYMSNGIRIGTLTDEVLHAMADAKCRGFSVGVESGNDETLAIIRKPLSIKMLYRKAEIFKKYPEIYVIGNYMVGFPFENNEQLMNTYKVAEDVGLDWNRFSVFTPLPGTPDFQKLDKKSQEEFDFNGVIYNVSYQAKRNYETAIEEQMEKQMHASLSYENEEDISKDFAYAHEDKRIYELNYIKNLEINFIKNKNLKGGNVDRAIRDFKGILIFFEKNHPIAHYCLAKAYQYKGDYKLVQQHLNKAFDILANPSNQKWVEYFDKVVPKNALNELRYSTNKDTVQA